MVHERTSWRVDGGFPEGKLASVALLEVLIVLLISDVWSSLWYHYCFAALSLHLFSGLPRPPPQHPTSFHSSESNRAFNRRHKPSHTILKVTAVC